GEDVPMIVGNPIHLDARIVAPAGELPGVAEQIVEYDARQGTVGHDLHPILDLDRNLPIRIAVPELVHDLPGHRTHIYQLQVPRLARYARQLQDLLDQVAHPHAVEAHALDIVARRLVELDIRRSACRR